MNSSGPSDAEFPSTRWNVVLAAKDPRAEAAREALDDLCNTYWLPVYAFVRRRTSQVDDARELTQEFFVRLLDGGLLPAADPARGKFRALLLSAVRNFLANEHERAAAQKRGGGRPLLSLDFDQAESRIANEPTDWETPERLFERQWALAVLDTVLNRLQAEFEQAGRSEQFRLLKPFLTSGDSMTSQAALARQLGGTAGAARAAVFRFRRRYQEVLRQEIAQTVDSPADVDQELRDLLKALEPG